MKLKTSLAVLLFNFLFMGLAQADTIRIATEGDNPPFNMKNKKGEVTGFEFDITRALCHQMKTDCEIVEQDKADLISGLMEKKYDAIIAGVSISAEKNKQLSFSDPYYSKYLRFIGKKDSELTLSSTGLQGKKLGVLTASKGAKYLQGNFKDSASVKPYANLEAAFQDLKTGQLDAVLVDAYQGYNWLLQADNSGFDLVGEKIDVNDRFSVAVRKGDKALQVKLNDALKAILANGTYKRINWNYFPYDVY